jgi:hypothetical protein
LVWMYIIQVQPFQPFFFLLQFSFAFPSTSSWDSN